MRMAKGVRFGLVSASIVRDPALSRNARLLYAVIATYATQETREWTISRRRLANDLGVSVDTVKRALGELTESGVLVRERQHREDGREGVALTRMRDFVAVYGEEDQ